MVILDSSSFFTPLRLQTECCWVVGRTKQSKIIMGFRKQLSTFSPFSDTYRPTTYRLSEKKIDILISDDDKY